MVLLWVAAGLYFAVLRSAHRQSFLLTVEKFSVEIVQHISGVVVWAGGQPAEERPAGWKRIFAWPIR